MKRGHKTELTAFKSHISKLKRKRVPQTEYEIELFKLMDFPNIKLPGTKKSKLKQKRFHKINGRIGSLFESYYYMNHAFLKKDQLLDNAYRLKNIPGFIIHGRFDLICSPDNSFKLSQKWKRGKLKLVPMAGHSMWNKNNAKELQKAYDYFSKGK